MIPKVSGRPLQNDGYLEDLCTQKKHSFFTGFSKKKHLPLEAVLADPDGNFWTLQIRRRGFRVENGGEILLMAEIRLTTWDGAKTL